MVFEKPTLFEIPKICDPRGNLSVLQYPGTLPFEAVRTYWIYDIPGGAIRDGHAYHSQQEIIIALSGSFDVTTETDDERQRVTLSRSNQGLYIPPLTWREIDRFSTNAVALILSSSLYNEIDYIRDKKTYYGIIGHEIE